MATVQDGPPTWQSVIQAAQRRQSRNSGMLCRAFLHCLVAQREPLLYEMDAQQRLHWERRGAAFVLRHVWLDQRHQFGPGHHPVPLVEAPIQGASAEWAHWSRAIMLLLSRRACDFSRPEQTAEMPSAHDVCRSNDMHGNYLKSSTI